MGQGSYFLTRPVVPLCNGELPEKLNSMALKNRTRLRKLCSRAMAESDPHKLAVLLTEIDNVLCETLDELADMLEEVEQVLKKRESTPKIHLA